MFCSCISCLLTPFYFYFCIIKHGFQYSDIRDMPTLTTQSFSICRPIIDCGIHLVYTSGAYTQQSFQLLPLLSSDIPILYIANLKAHSIIRQIYPISVPASPSLALLFVLGEIYVFISSIHHMSDV